jgi:hypothetical protein
MEINIQNLIEALEELKEKGATTVEINGTLFCPQDGNTIIATTDWQM